MNTIIHPRRLAWLAPAILAGSLVAGAAFAQADAPDPPALDRKTAEIGQLQGKLLRARLDTAMRMRAVLTPEQRDQLGPGMWRGMMRGEDGFHGRRGMRRFRMSDGGP